MFITFLPFHVHFVLTQDETSPLPPSFKLPTCPETCRVQPGPPATARRTLIIRLTRGPSSTLPAESLLPASSGTRQAVAAPAF